MVGSGEQTRSRQHAPLQALQSRPERHGGDQLPGQLQTGTFEHAVHYLIKHKLDLSVFRPKYRNDDTGRRAYDPAILLKIILFVYSKGITSSRKMQWCCETNIIFKALSCDTAPHVTTLASFVSSHGEAIQGVFEQVLLVCHEQGLLGNELFAIDGCKISSNAAKEWSRTFKELGEKRDKLKRLIRHHLLEHHARDEAETEAQLDRDIRRAKTILSLDKALKKVDRFLTRISHAQAKHGQALLKKKPQSPCRTNQCSGIVIWAILTQLPWAEWQENPTLPAWIQAIGSVFALFLAIVVPAAQHMLSEHRIRKESAAYERRQHHLAVTLAEEAQDMCQSLLLSIEQHRLMGSDSVFPADLLYDWREKTRSIDYSALQPRAMTLLTETKRFLAQLEARYGNATGRALDLITTEPAHQASQAISIRLSQLRKLN